MRIPGLLIALFAVLLAGCGESPVAFHGKDITGVMDDLSFTLTDENGDTVTESIVDGQVVNPIRVDDETRAQALVALERMLAIT